MKIIEEIKKKKMVKKTNFCVDFVKNFWDCTRAHYYSNCVLTLWTAAYNLTPSKISTTWTLGGEREKKSHIEEASNFLATGSIYVRISPTNSSNNDDDDDNDNNNDIKNKD